MFVYMFIVPLEGTINLPRDKSFICVIHWSTFSTELS